MKTLLVFILLSAGLPILAKASSTLKISNRVPFYATDNMDPSGIEDLMEAQFKASVDELHIQFDIRDPDRRIEFSNTKKPDFISYGTFAYIHWNQYLLTYHLQDYKKGFTRSFRAAGVWPNVMNALALQVFNYFQKNDTPDWQSSNPSLQWIPMPIHPQRDSDQAYSFVEAKNYCTSRGYRLPYSRELLMAEAGGAYKPGGISFLKQNVSYAVADRRRSLDSYFLVPGHEEATGGPIEPDIGPRKGRFWCVKGDPALEILKLEKLWQLHREYKNKNKDVFIAIETLRFEIGDYDVHPIYWGKNFEKLQTLRSRDEALAVLKRHGIDWQ